MRFHITTYGCQMNVRDSDAARALLSRHGHTWVPREAEADVVIVNTCSVRTKAEEKALGKLGLLVAAKKRGSPERVVGAIGCMVQHFGVTLLEKVPGLDFAVGTHRLGRLPALLEHVLEGGAPIVDAGDAADEPDAPFEHGESGVLAFVNILFGCDRHCSYCIVPSVRGAEQSRAGADILAEVETLVAAGTREVTLLGQSVMSYGRRSPVWSDDFVSAAGYGEPLTRLLEVLSGVAGLARLRFTSGHPSGCTPELARAMGELPSVCEHLHMPVQSGSDRILARMNRGYTTEDYRRAVDRLRSVASEFGLTTDVIVGFPGETEEDFVATQTFMEEMKFDNAFIFKYSVRPGTPAASWADDVPDEEKRRRNQVLLADQDRRGLRINEALVGEVVEVLVTGPSRRNASRWSGRTRTNKIVIIEPVPGLGPGGLALVRIEKAMAQTLYGRVEAVGDAHV